MALSRTGCVAIGLDFCGLDFRGFDFCQRAMLTNIFCSIAFHFGVNGKYRKGPWRHSIRRKAPGPKWPLAGCKRAASSTRSTTVCSKPFNRLTFVGRGAPRLRRNRRFHAARNCRRVETLTAITAPFVAFTGDEDAGCAPASSHRKETP